MKKQKINQTINRKINSVLDLAESVYFGDQRLPLFRRLLLNNLNDLRRELLAHLEDGRHPNNMGDTVVTSYHDPFRRDPLVEGVWRE